MLKTLGAQIKEFKKDSLITPVFMILEVIMEMIIPLMMASIIDKGVEAGDMGHIYRMGGLMIAAAIIISPGFVPSIPSSPGEIKAGPLPYPVGQAPAAAKGTVTPCSFAGRSSTGRAPAPGCCMGPPPR